MSEFPTLIAVAHGTRSPAGRRQIERLASAVARRRPGLDVRLCYVDVQEPKVADVVPDVEDAVVVPLLLSCGYHVRVDIADAVKSTRFPVAPPLGPDPVFLASLRRNLPDADAVVLASAGSSDPLWVAGIREVAAQLAGTEQRVEAGSTPESGSRAESGHTPESGSRVETGFTSGSGSQVEVGLTPGNAPRVETGFTSGNAPRVEIGYTSGSGPRVEDVVERLRQEGARTVAVAAYLLAEGLFYRTLHGAGADSVTPPLCHDPAVVDLVLRRFDDALPATAGGRFSGGGGLLSHNGR